MNKYNKNNAFTYPGEKRDSGMEDASNGRKGIAKELLSRVVNDARNYGCGTIQITASDMGVKLYTDFGFVHNGNFMQYKL
ncbi:MAG: GNAT family N-acetyltransferase [Coprococcus sp.]